MECYGQEMTSGRKTLTRSKTNDSYMVVCGSGLSGGAKCGKAKYAKTRTKTTKERMYGAGN